LSVVCAIPFDTQLVMANCLNGEDGIRTAQENPAKSGVSDIGGAESGAHTGQFALIDSGLARISEAWPRLPEAIRKAMLLLAESKE
jgi:hypothetical protein